MTSAELYEKFAKKLRAWMKANHVNACELAVRCGVSNAAPARWANGTRLPRAYELRCLCEATGLSADDLLGLR